ncbi:MAG: iron-containing alcohol dehydrogenase [Candidatus Aenigmarchaeota archaeon]|nr:iron-containing alcohol dehydrogenase [Candidatus Aenigmarchaeota archaeon]
MGIKELLQERNIKLEYKEDKNADFSELRGKAIITNDDAFTKNLLLKAGFENFYTISEASIETAEQIKKMINGKVVVGFGGGKAIDVAKKVALDLNLELISVPTAPSHDGLISKNCSLYNGKRRETLPAKYPSKIIIPINLWKNSGNLKKAGICDLLSNLIALQDLSLGEKEGERFSEFYKKLSCEAAEKADYKNEKELAEALILSGIAMEETSRYCSGSEHEVERLLESRINNGKYLHGQLAGIGALISAKVYEIHSSELQNLRFDSKKLFEMLKEKMMKSGVYEFAIEPLKNEKFKHELLKEVSQIRPERFTLWNVVDSREVDWNKVIGSILG